jgi:hypothetical protein
VFLKITQRLRAKCRQMRQIPETGSLKTFDSNEEDSKIILESDKTKGYNIQYFKYTGITSIKNLLA